MTTTAAPTIEDLESLAAAWEEEAGTRRARLAMLIPAYARMLPCRAPQTFNAKALVRADEDGHYDSSFPASVELKEFAGPKRMTVVQHSFEDIATTGGFCYEWRRSATDAGLYVSPSDELYGCNETGTGKLGQFAAYPGDCNVECSLSWIRPSLDDAGKEHLQTAEKELRVLAFPLVTAAARTATT